MEVALETKQNLTVLGNEAVAFGLRDGGTKYVAAYPGTPSTEIMETLIKRFKGDMKADWSSNEAVATEEALAAAITGTDSATVFKSVGLNVAMDPIMTLSLMGVNASMVIVVADDPGMHSSQNEQDNRIISRFADLPMFVPSNIQECYDFTREAVKLSRTFQIPVFVRLVTRISHSLGTFERRPKQELPEIVYEKNAQRYVSIPGNARRNKSRILKIRKEVESYLASQKYYKEFVIGENPEYLVVTCGSSYNYAIEALDFFGLSAHILKLDIVYPFPKDRFLELAREYKKLLVIEELEPFIEKIIDFILADYNIDIKLYGKKNGLTSAEGELTAEKLEEWMAYVLNLEYSTPRRIDLKMQDLLRMRPPVLCAGCPHRSTYTAMERSFKKYNPIYLNDIGCYSLGVLPPQSKADVLICMGASIPMATSVSFTKPDNLAVAVIGDSTFWHSGVTGLANAIWKKANIVVVVMDNGTTAMTGAQPNPSANDSSKLDIAKTAMAMGAFTRVVDPMDYDATKKVMREVMEHDGVRVIVAEHECALTYQKSLKLSGEEIPLAAVEPELCIGCERCIKPIGCPALSMNENNIAVIDPLLCDGCMYCAEHCPKDAIKLVERK